MVPSMTQILLKYHTVAPERLVAATLRDLAASGIPERALGHVLSAMRVTLVACTVLNDHARSYLPEALGGTADGLDASEDTLSLADASFARSPAGRAVREGPLPTAALDPRSSPVRSLFDDAPSSPASLARARAARDAAEAAVAAAEEARAADEAAAASPPARRRRSRAAQYPTR